MKQNILKDKSYCFAVRIVHLYKYLTTNNQEYVLSRQLLRSGTAVGAMVCESEYSESNKDFIHKLSIVQKELNESSIYWLDLLFATNYLTEQEYKNIKAAAVEIMKILISSIKTLKRNFKENKK